MRTDENRCEISTVTDPLRPIERAHVHAAILPGPALGIGGYFLRAADSAALGAWYRDCLGLDADEHGQRSQGVAPTVFATFESETDYFESLPADHAQLPRP